MSHRAVIPLYRFVMYAKAMLYAIVVCGASCIGAAGATSRSIIDGAAVLVLCCCVVMVHPLTMGAPVAARRGGALLFTLIISDTAHNVKHLNPLIVGVLTRGI